MLWLINFVKKWLVAFSLQLLAPHHYPQEDADRVGEEWAKS